MSDKEISESVFYIYFSTDSKALPFLKKIIALGGTYVPNLDPSKTEFRFTHETTLQTLIEVRDQKDIYPLLDKTTVYFYENLCEALFITRNIPGDYVEIGVFHGRSLLTATKFIGKMTEKGEMLDRNIYGLDTFHGFDYEESENSSDIIWHQTHIVNPPDKQIEIIIERIAPKNIKFNLIINNIISDELPSKIDQIAVAVIDVDLYEATEAALEKIHDRIALGGIIICEDPASTPQLYGSYVAMENFLQTVPGKKFTKIFKKGSYFLLRVS